MISDTYSSTQQWEISTNEHDLDNTVWYLMDDKPEDFIAFSLSPANVLDVIIMPKGTALCFVPESLFQ